MGWVDHLTDEELKNAVLESVTKLYVLTGERVRPDEPYVTWFYQICCDDPLDASEFLTVHFDDGCRNFCDCLECSDFNGSLYTYYSVLQALKWIRQRYPLVDVELWVDSERFYSDWKYLSSYEGLYNCVFLKTLGRELECLLGTFGTTVRRDCDCHCDCEMEESSYVS